MVADANYEVPLAFKVTTASRNDSPELRDVVDKALEQLPWLEIAALTADRGYDSYANFDYLEQKGILPIIKIRQSAHGALKQGIYTKDGVPTCIGKVEMKYVRSEGGKHLYRCAGCALKDSKVGMTTHCDTEVWEDPARNLRLFGPPHIRREGKEWRELYLRRQGIERIFRSLKAVLRLERHCTRGLDQIRLHTLMSTLAFQANFLISKKAGLGAKEARWMIARVA